ncbi:MAG TPA: serine hydrolase [Vulgatibacter sp.]|nr:serine hydrolase [Vulgatibacter sp.]
MRLRIAFLVLFAALIQACAHAPAAAPLPEAEVPKTPAGERLAWFLEVLNERGGELTTDEVEAAFAPIFLEQIPASQMVAITRQVSRQVKRLSLASVREASPHSLVAIASSGEARLRISVAVAAKAPHRFTGLQIGPARPEHPRPQTWEAVESDLAKLAPRTNLLAARIEGDRCEPLREVNADALLALGSTFKLYVLLAAADAASAGTLDWKSKLAVREEWKSLPSGVMQDEPAGGEFALEDVARQMISISDNTATDHLLRTVGREAVEAAMARTGHAAPQQNRPFLSTRELFLLKLGDEAGREAFLAADEAGRRALLAELASAPLPSVSAAASWKKPRAIDTLEWFASPADLCGAMVALKEAGSAEGSPIFGILGQNPGVRYDPERWAYVGFKGGSEPGVMNLTFLLRRKADDAWFFLTVGANDTEQGIDGEVLVAIAEGALVLLGELPASREEAPAAAEATAVEGATAAEEATTAVP